MEDKREIIEKSNGSSILRFTYSNKIDIGSEVVEWTQDEMRGLHSYALLNNDIIIIDNSFQVKYRVNHEGGKKINKIKLNDGIVCVAGEDNMISFYDPNIQKRIKSIPSISIIISEKRSI